VSWTAPAGQSATDWIGIYRVGDPEAGFISYQYTGGAPSGSVQFTALSQAGQYEFRYFTNDSFTRVATSNTVTVGGSFSAVSVASPISNPTAMTFAPDGRLFVCQQTGELRVIDGGVLQSTPFTTLTVNSSGERGLLGVAFDPNFATNQFVYVYYTATTPAIHNRVSRFTANGNVAVVGSEVPILDLNNLSGATNHNGGAIHFGPDGLLYIAVGENANSANSQSIGNLLGKILRINSNGTIPSDNPTTFPGIAGSPSGNNRAIWSVGLRNPFTFDFQAGTGRMFINDVGQTTWEEINDGIAGSNYGWAICEGACSPPNANYRDPLFQYGHGIGSSTGCAITGGAFYNPSVVTYPSEYLGKYFYAEFCSGWIRRFDPATSTSQAFATGLSSPVDLKVGPDGNLYYLVRGGGGAVFKIIYS
jgi:glucose/arabinose dehydrogenase